jgi:putative methyltransferase (TIGR04325 family)
VSIKKALQKLRKYNVIKVIHSWFSRTKGKRIVAFSKQEILYGYQNSNLVSSIVRRNIIFRKELSTSRIPAEAFSTIAGIGMAIQGVKKLCVLDFGGGGGNHHAIAQQVYPNIQFTWTIIETGEMVREIKGKISEPGLSFLDGIEKFDGSVDLVFSNSAIQYCENPSEILESFKNLKPKYIFLTRTPLTNKNQVIRYVQKSKLSSNGPRIGIDFPEEKIEVSYEATIIPESQMQAIFSEDYEFTCTFKEDKWDDSQFGDLIVNYGYFLTRKRESLLFQTAASEL